MLKLRFTVHTTISRCTIREFHMQKIVPSALNMHFCLCCGGGGAVIQLSQSKRELLAKYSRTIFCIQTSFVPHIIVNYELITLIWMDDIPTSLLSKLHDVIRFEHLNAMGFCHHTSYHKIRKWPGNQDLHLMCYMWLRYIDRAKSMWFCSMWYSQQYHMGLQPPILVIRPYRWCKIKNHDYPNWWDCHKISLGLRLRELPMTFSSHVILLIGSIIMGSFFIMVCSAWWVVDVGRVAALQCDVWRRNARTHACLQYDHPRRSDCRLSRRRHRTEGLPRIRMSTNRYVPCQSLINSLSTFVNLELK